MSKLKLGPIEDERPAKLAIELPAAVHRDLVAYATLLAKESGQAAEPARLVAPMLAQFMASDRAFAKQRRLTAAKDRATHETVIHREQSRSSGGTPTEHSSRSSEVRNPNTGSSSDPS